MFLTEFGSLKRGQHKNLAKNESALVPIFLLTSTSSGSVWYVSFFVTWHFRNCRFVIVCVINSCCKHERGQKKLSRQLVFIREEFSLLLTPAIFGSQKTSFLFISCLLEILNEPSLAVLPNVIFYTAFFIWADLLCTRTETGSNLSDTTAGNDFCTCEETNGTLEEQRHFVHWPSKDFDCIRRYKWTYNIFAWIDPTFLV